MASAEPDPEGGSEDGGGGRTHRSPSGSVPRVAPLGPEQLQRVLEQVAKAKAQALAEPPSPFALQDAVQRLRDAAQQATLQRAPGSEPPPRLLPPQHLEAICVKVTSGETKVQGRPMPQLATIQPRVVRSSLLTGRHCGEVALGVASPLLLQAQPHPSTQPQPPIRVLVQRPLRALRPGPVRKVAVPRAGTGLGTAPALQLASDLPARASASPSSASVFISDLCTKHTENLKKALKVKTRSGRISRPPKYKAKDYKFIKMEDLADSHPSDSDDYSELSVEDEERQDKHALFDLPSCSLRPRAFQCPACEKSYIGKGGLARHFKLNPGHGPPLPQPETGLSGKTNGSGIQGHSEGTTAGLMSARGGLQTGQSAEAKEALVSEPADASCPALLGTERCPELERGCSPAPPEPGVTVLQLSRTARSRARLKEFLHRCNQQDLVELALPSLAQAVTVCDFLLMKVEKQHVEKPVFPAVYKEFEELHKMVKKMCQDYLRSSGPSSWQCLEIHNDEVATSLGIPKEFLRKEAHTGGILHQCSGLKKDGAEPETSSPKKRESEKAEEGLASMKRTRRAASLEEPPESSVDSGGLQQPAGWAPVAREGFIPPVNGDACHCPEGHRLLASDGDPSASQASGQLRALADPMCLDASGPGLHSQLGQPRTLTPEQTAAFPTEHAQGRSSDRNVGDSLESQELAPSLISEAGVASPQPGGSGCAEADLHLGAADSAAGGLICAHPAQQPAAPSWPCA